MLFQLKKFGSGNLRSKHARLDPGSYQVVLDGSSLVSCHNLCALAVTTLAKLFVCITSELAINED